MRREGWVSPGVQRGVRWCATLMQPAQSLETASDLSLVLFTLQDVGATPLCTSLSWPHPRLSPAPASSGLLYIPSESVESLIKDLSVFSPQGQQRAETLAGLGRELERMGSRGCTPSCQL